MIARRHDADHAIQVVVQPQAFAANIRIGPESPLPKTVADETFQSKSGRLILWIKRLAQLRFHVQQRKIIRRHVKKADAFGLGRAREVHVPAPQRRNVGKNAGAPKILPFRHGHSHVPRAHAGKIILDADELVRLRVRQRVQQCRIDDAENRRCRSDAQGNRQHSDGGEAGRLAQHAQTVADVLPEVLAPQPPPRFVKPFLGAQDIAKRAPRRSLRLFFTHPRLPQALDLVLQVRLNFRAEIVEFSFSSEHSFLPLTRFRVAYSYLNASNGSISTARRAGR